MFLDSIQQKETLMLKDSMHQLVLFCKRARSFKVWLALPRVKYLTNFLVSNIADSVLSCNFGINKLRP